MGLDKRNILFFFTDDQRFDTIHALGNDHIHTPHLDELVKQGMTFTHAHIPGGTSGAICMPSRAMLHTGRTLFNLIDSGEDIPPEHALMGEVFQREGYKTYGIGKWHNGKTSYNRSFGDGDEIFFGGMSDHWNVPAYHYDPSGAYTSKLKVIHDPEANNIVSYRDSDHVHAGKHSTNVFSDAATRWIEAYDHDDPFFLYISYMAPHDPRSMPEEFLEMYDPDHIDLPLNYMAQHPFEFGVRRIRDEKLANYPRTEAEIRRHIAEYYAMITHLDHELGNVITSLKQSGKYENTIIVFAGDNGLALGQHGLMGKQNNYEHSIRVPLIFAGPGIPKDVRHDAYVYLLDIFPTLCEMNGIDIPDTVEGSSLHPIINGTQKKVRDTLYFAYTNLIRSVKDEQYKLIEYRSEYGHYSQLFDLLRDPYEVNNIFYDAEYTSIIERLRAELVKYSIEWNDRNHPIGKGFWDRFGAGLNS